MNTLPQVFHRRDGLRAEVFERRGAYWLLVELPVERVGRPCTIDFRLTTVLDEARRFIDVLAEGRIAVETNGRGQCRLDCLHQSLRKERFHLMLKYVEADTNLR